MKKLLVLGAVVALGMSSCKKDYTCECTATDTFYNSSITFEAKKKDATETCDGLETSGASIEGYKCELK